MIAQLDPLYLRTRFWKLWSRLLSYTLFEGRPLTTKGQWINPLVFALLGLLKRLPPISAVREPVFILGTGRSGTTVLGIVLSMHRDVGFLNEPKALWHSIYPGEDLIGSYSCDSASYRLNAGDVTDSCGNWARRIYAAYLAITFSQRVVDKYPELIFRVPFVREIFPDAKFIFLVRNGWDTCASIEGWSNRFGKVAGVETHDWWGANRRKWCLLVEQLIPEHPDLAPHADAMHTWTNHTDMAAVEWIVTMRQGIKLLEQYPGNVMKVDYEKLCADPRQQLMNVMNFCGLRNDELFLQYGELKLMPIVTKSSFKLNAAIECAFTETMQKLGYET